MEVVSLSPLRVFAVAWQPRAGAHRLTVVAKATFQIFPGESPLADTQEDIVEDDNHWNDDPARSVYSPSDCAPFKMRAEVVVVGHAFAPRGEPVRSLVARVIVAEMDKAVEIVGARAKKDDEPAPFARMPLRYERAAGGGETMNPVGVDIDGDVQPNLVPVGARGSGFIEPVGFGPVAPTWPFRRTQLGRHAGTWSRTNWSRAPLPEDIELGYFNAAPRDQQIETIRDNERMILENLHPDHSPLVTRLPGVHPRAFVERARGPEELVMRGDTLWIDTDRALCTLTWRGQVALDSAAEAGRVLVALERGGQRLSWADVERLAANRPAKKAQTLEKLPGQDVGQPPGFAAPGGPRAPGLVGDSRPTLIGGVALDPRLIEARKVELKPEESAPKAPLTGAARFMATPPPPLAPGGGALTGRRRPLTGPPPPLEATATRVQVPPLGKREIGPPIMVDELSLPTMDLTMTRIPGLLAAALPFTPAPAGPPAFMQQAQESGRTARPAMIDHPDRRGAPIDHPDRRGAPIDHPDRRGAPIDQPDRRGAPIDHPDRRGAPIDHPDRRGAPIDDATATEDPPGLTGAMPAWLASSGGVQGEAQKHYARTPPPTTPVGRPSAPASAPPPPLNALAKPGGAAKPPPPLPTPPMKAPPPPKPATLPPPPLESVTDTDAGARTRQVAPTLLAMGESREGRGPRKEEGPRVEEGRASPPVEERRAATARVEDGRATGAGVEEARLAKPRVEEARLGKPRVEEARLAEPGLDEARAAKLAVEEVRLAPRVEEARLAKPRVEEARLAKPRVEEARLAKPRVEEARLAKPRVEEVSMVGQRVGAEVFELLHVDAGALTRVRRDPALKPLLEVAGQGARDEEPGDAEGHARRLVYGVLARAPAIDVSDAADSIPHGVAPDGTYAAPVLIVAGELELGFSEVEVLRATLLALEPLLPRDGHADAAEAALAEAVQLAGAWLAKLGGEGASSVADALTQRIRDAVARATRFVSPGYVEAHTERIALERRAYQTRPVLGDRFVRAQIASATGAAVPVYIPGGAALRVPLFRRFSVRALVEVHPRQDQYEGHHACLRVLALGRRLAPPASSA